MQDLNCVFQGLDGKGAIYISTIHAARNLNLLKKHKIAAVLSIAKGAHISFNKQEIPHYLFIPAHDHHEYDLSQHFQQTYAFIQSVRKQTNVLIHCMAGKSRSATITAAYLIKKFQYSLEKVLKHLQRKRAIIDPNPGFMKQLALLEKEMLEEKKEKDAILQEKIDHCENKKAKINRSLSHSPSKYNTPPVSPEKNLSFIKVHDKIEQNPLNLFITPKQRQKASSPSPKKGKSSVGCKIDRIKSNLKIKGMIKADDPNAIESPSPCKVYSPLLYRNRPKIAFFQ